MCVITAAENISSLGFRGIRMVDYSLFATEMLMLEVWFTPTKTTL